MHTLNANPTAIKKIFIFKGQKHRNSKNIEKLGSLKKQTIYDTFKECF